ncbi:recombinase RecT [Paenibacillus larvae]|nr:RecT family recombinase [Paenibacillus larvae]MDT2265429.1 recombinase RecT [Paenibacillus larvae]
MFVRTAAATGLNPFLNQIYCIVYNGKNGPQMSIQISVEGIVSLGKKHPEYKGFIAAEVKENDEFKANYQGEMEHEITTMQRGQTVGAYCIAYREGAPNVLVIVTKDRIRHHLKGRNPDMWRDYFDDMITKHTIKRAFKRQYGVEISEDNHTAQGNSVENIPAYEPTRKDITQEVDVTATSPEPKIEHPKQQTTAETDDEKLRQLKAEMKRSLRNSALREKKKWRRTFLNISR